MANTNLVYLSPMDVLSCDIAYIVTPVLCMCLDKITWFSKGNHQLTVFEFQNSALFVAFPSNPTTFEPTTVNLIGLLKSTEFGCCPGQKVI